MKKISKKLMGTAYHEAGHAVVAIDFRRPILSVSIVPDDDSYGRVIRGKPPSWVDPECVIDQRTVEWIEQEVQIFCAGDAAERRFTGRGNKIGPQGDNRQTADYLSYLCDGPAAEFSTYWKLLSMRTRRLVGKPWIWQSIQRLAEELLVCQEMPGRKARQVVMEARAGFFKSELDKAS